MSKGKVKPMPKFKNERPKVQAELMCTITRQGNLIVATWAKNIPQGAKVQVLNNLSFAEHEVLIRHKYFNKSNMIDPHTGKPIMIPKDNPSA